MKSLLLVLAVVLVGCGGGKQEETEGPSQPEPTTPPQATLPTEPQPEPTKAVPANIADPIVEKAIRKQLNKPTGELTKADLERVTELGLYNNQLTSVKGLEKLTQLTRLGLEFNKLTSVKGLEKLTKLEELSLGVNQLTSVKGLEKLTELKELNLTRNPDLTKAQIAELQKALPKCKITHDATKEDGRPKPKVGIRMGSDGLAYLESGNTLYTGQMIYTDEKKGFVRTMNFRKGKLHGILSQKYPDGRKFGEAHYVDGVKHGDSIKWYPNGQKQQHRIYLRGQLQNHQEWENDGTQKVLANWNPDGTPIGLEKQKK